MFNGFCPMCLRWICSTWRQHVQNRANVEYVKCFRGNLRETKDTVRVSLQEYLFASSSKATSSGFWQKRVRLSDLLEGSLTVLQEPALTVLLVLPKIEGVEKAKHFNAQNRGNIKYVKHAKCFQGNRGGGVRRAKNLTYLTFPLF